MLSARNAQKRNELEGSTDQFALQSSFMEIDAYSFVALAPAAFEAAPVSGPVGAPSAVVDLLSDASDAAVYGETGAAAGGSASAGATVAVSAAYTVNVARDAYIARPNGLYNMAQMFQVNAGVANAPASLQLTVYDRQNYAGVETQNFGTMTTTNGASYKAPGYTVTFNNVGGQYLTANGLSLADFDFKASTQEDRLSNFNLMAYSSTGVLLTSRDVSVVTHAIRSDASAGVATASEIAAVAQSFIGKTWDSNGCWVLACDIAATSGSSLPFNSGWITSAITGNGQWGMAYNAYNGINASWMSSLKAGDMVELGWKNANFGHIFTVDRVVNGAAYLVDNSGAFLNTPGSDPTDLTIVERKLSDYAAYINQSTVVVFRDTGVDPVVTNLGPTTDVTAFTNLQTGKTIAAGSLFAASDPDYDSITQFRVMDASNNGGYFALNGVHQSAGAWTTVSSAQLANLTYTSATWGSTSETIQVQAFDGKSWGNVDTGRIVSLWDQTGQKDEQTFRNLGVIDKANAPTRATEWVGSTDKYDWWTFSIATTPTAVDIQLANMTAMANMLVFNSQGALVGSVYGSAYNNTSAKLTGTLGVGTYTVRIDDYLGDTDYDLTIGKAGTLPNVMSGGASRSIYGASLLSATSGGPADGGFSPLNGTAPSLSFADASGLGQGSGSIGLLPAPANQNDRAMLLTQTA